MKKKNQGLGIGRDEAVKAGKFLLGLSIAYLILDFLFSFIPLEAVGQFYASIVLFFLSLLGFSGGILAGDVAIMQLGSFGQGIAITYLCTGLLEMKILLASIIASFGIPLKKRAIGIAGAMAATIIFNILRIFGSIYIILVFGLPLGEFSHNLLFRVFLFLIIFGFYAAWFCWATGTSIKMPKIKIMRKNM